MQLYQANSPNHNSVFEQKLNKLSKNHLQDWDNIKIERIEE